MVMMANRRRSMILKRCVLIGSLALRVIDIEPRQIEQAREPRDHRDDVKCLEPEHGIPFRGNRRQMTKDLFQRRRFV